MNKQKGRYRLVRSIVLYLVVISLFVILISGLVQAACLKNLDTNECRTGNPGVKTDKEIVADQDGVCIFERDGLQNKYRCRSDDAPELEEFPHCCSVRGGALGTHGYLTTQKAGISLRNNYGETSYPDHPDSKAYPTQLRCYPGNINADGTCEPRPPALISMDPQTKTPQEEGFLTCEQNEVICGFDFSGDPSSQSNEAIGYATKLKCCPVGEKIAVSQEGAKRYMFDATQPHTKEICKSEGAGFAISAMCGAHFAQSGDEYFVNGILCCPVTSRTNQRAQLVPGIRSRYGTWFRSTGDNKLCSPNEVLKEGSARKHGALSLLSSAWCSPIKVCEEAPNCSKPLGDADCNGRRDGEEEACQDQDNDGVLDPVDNCPAVRNPNQEDENNDGIGDKCSELDDGKEICESFGYEWVGPEEGGACCGDDGAEYFDFDNHVCFDEQSITGFDIGADTNLAGIIGQGTITLEGFQYIGGEDHLFELRKKSDSFVNKFLIEFTAKVDATADPETQLQVDILKEASPNHMDKINVDGTVGVFPGGTKKIKRVISMSGGGRTLSPFLKIVIRKQGTGQVQFSDLKIFNYIDKRFLFNQGDYFYCGGTEDAERNFMFARGFTMTGPDDGDRLVHDGEEDHVKEACTVVEKPENVEGSGFPKYYCDADGTWYSGAGEIHKKDFLSEELLQHLGIEIQDVFSFGCCKIDECWDGTKCVRSGGESSLFEKENKAVVCIREGNEPAEWAIADMKQDQYRQSQGFCQEEQCWWSSQNQGSHRCVGNGFVSTDVDFVCEKGIWQTRLGILGKEMLKVKDANRQAALPDEYSLYCDDHDKVFLDEETQTHLWNEDIEKAFSPEQKVCILSYNHATWRPISLSGFLLSQVLPANRNIIIGVLLDPDEEDTLSDPIASASPDFVEDYCGGTKTEWTNQFVGCKGPGNTIFDEAHMYFNKDLNALIYSKDKKIYLPEVQ